MPKISTPTYGGSYAGNSPRTGSLEQGNTLDGPSKMSDEGHGSRTSIAHHWPAPKGERAADYPQIQPNPSATRDSVRYGQAIPNSLNHGSAAHGGPKYNQRNISVGVENRRMKVPRNSIG